MTTDTDTEESAATAAEERAATAAEAPALREADLARIKRCIPHRFPFLLIDRVEAIDPGKNAVGIKLVTANEPHFQGHFPEEPIMPGVLIVEAMAQTAGVLVVETLNRVDDNLLVYFMTIDKTRFRRKVVPGDLLELHVSILRSRGPVWKFSGSAKVGGELAAEAEFSAMIIDEDDSRRGPSGGGA
ncbi:MAG: 3-hydroxyacyl-ACP dehydratase FabZ [Pseudomonadota bacterium]